jgi:tRNA A37 threonylcarbamoyladenosine biosynthesis protein TsaE
VISLLQNYSITNVLHVDPLGYNLLSVSQLSEIGFDYHFSDKGVSIIRREDSSIVLTGLLRGGGFT